MIAYECPECFEPMQSPDEHAGEVQECPICGKDVPVPHHGEIVASEEDAYYEPPDDSSDDPGKVALASMMILVTIGGPGSLAIYIWTVYLFFEHWGTFWGVMSLLTPGLAQLVAMFTCVGWGVWFYIIAIAAWFSCLGGGLTLMSSDMGRAAKVIMPSIALALVGTFAYFAYEYAVSPTPRTAELSKRLEDDAVLAIDIITNGKSRDPLVSAKCAEARSIFRKRTADYDKSDMAEIRRLVDAAFALKWSVQNDIIQWSEEWFADHNSQFSFSDQSLRLQEALPQKIRTIVHQPGIQERIGENMRRTLVKAAISEDKMPDALRDNMIASYAGLWKLYAVEYEGLFGEPMPSFTSDH